MGDFCALSINTYFQFLCNVFYLNLFLLTNERADQLVFCPGDISEFTGFYCFPDFVHS